MINKTLVELIKKISNDQNNSIGVVRNILGNVSVADLLLGTVTSSEWAVYYIGETMQQLTPQEIYNRMATDSSFSPVYITSLTGSISFVPSNPGTYLFTTVIKVPQTASIPIDVNSRSNNISLYIDHTIIKKSIDKLYTTVTVANDVSLNIVVYGGNGPINISIPSDIQTSISDRIPSVPEWRSETPIETNYVDPRTGNTGNALFWANQAMVGGWGIYKIDNTNVGKISAIGSIGGGYLLTVSGTTGYPVSIPNNAVLVSSGVELGAVSFYLLDSGTNNAIIRLREFNTVDTTSILSGIAYIREFTHITDIFKSSSDYYISFVDTNIKVGNSYSYALDSFSQFNPMLRSKKTDIRTVTAGDVTPPGPITSTSVSVYNNIMRVAFDTPVDEDYHAIRTYKYLGGSSYTHVYSDLGIPNTRDSFVFEPIGSGTYYFVTIDKAGNQQIFASGVSYFWNGVGALTDINLPPLMQARLLSSEETTTDGYDPKLIARFELNASGQAGESLFVNYRGVGDSGWNSSAVPPAVKVNVSKQDKSANNWLRIRAFDSILYSDELVLTADYDTNPEVSSVNSYIDFTNNTVYVNGAVDDDTKSVAWKIRDSYSAGTLLSSGVDNDTESDKLFSFNFSIPDGTRRHLSIIPYTKKNTGSPAGLNYEELFDAPPRTRVIVTEGTGQTALSHDTALVTFAVNPSTASTYYKVDSGIPYTYTLYTTSFVINKSGKDKSLYYYSQVPVLPGGSFLREEEQKLNIDLDTIPEISSGTMIETSTGTITISITDVDEDVKAWEAYVRRGQWPTIDSGFENFGYNRVDSSYLRFRGSPEFQTQFSFNLISVNSGTWYAIAVPYDSYYNPGPNLGLTCTIGSGTATTNPVITSLSVVKYDRDSPHEDNNKIKYNTQNAETNNATIRIYWYSSDMSPDQTEEITTGTRYAWQDSERNDSYSNADDGSSPADTVTVNYGSFLHRVFRGTKGINPWLTYYYLVKLYNSGSLVASYETSNSGYYIPE